VTSGREDAERILAAAPASVGTIPPSLSGLTRVGPATNEPFILDGRRLLVRGSQKEPGASVDFVGRGLGQVVAEVRTDSGSAANLLQFPGVARREFIGPGGLGHETILAAATLPFTVFQWRDGATPRVVEVAIHGAGTSPGEPHPVWPTVARSERAVVLRLQADVWVGVSVTPDPESLTLEGVTEAEGAAVAEREARPEDVADAVVRVVPTAGAPVSLVIAVGSASDVCSAFAAASHAPGHAIRAASGPTEGLYLDTGVAELDDGVAWLQARVAGIVNRGGTSTRREDDTSDLMLGLAALAVGDQESSNRLGRLMEAGTPSVAILAAQTAAVFGETGRAEVAAERLLSGHGEGDQALFALAAGMLADGLRYAAAEATISALRDRGNQPHAPASALAHDPADHGATARRLPVVGLPTTRHSVATWLTGLLHGAPPEPPGGGAHDIDTVRRAAARFAADPDAAWATWRQVLAAGMVSGPDGPATWDHLHGPGGEDGGGKGRTEQDSIAAELLLALTHGLLGIAADAPVGRLHLAPRLPSHLTQFTAGGIRLGATRIRMDFERIGPTARFSLEPERAAVPPLVVFEPTVHGRIKALRVDGEVADLSHTARAGLTTLSLQLPLDGRRVLEVDVAV
jgi:hypothetical protein